MVRVVAGIFATLLLVTGAVVLFSSRAQEPVMPAAPEARLAAPSAPVRLSPIGQAPSADPKSKEEKRFDRSDKNKDGTITLAELVEPRRKPFAKLDLDGDGKLSFEEWAVRTIDKFEEADSDKSRGLSRVEYASTAPKPRAPKPQCACG